MKREDEGRSGTMHVVRDSYETRVTSTISNTPPHLNIWYSSKYNMMKVETLDERWNPKNQEEQSQQNVEKKW